MEKNLDVSVRKWKDLTDKAGEAGADMALQFCVTGVSMVPTIRHQQDTVIVLPLRRKPKVGDIVLFQRQNTFGKYVLHRVCEVEDEGVRTIGDGNLHDDGWTRMEEIYGVAVALKKGKRSYDLQKGAFAVWGKLWLALRPVRKPLLALFEFLAKEKKWIHKIIISRE